MSVTWSRWTSSGRSSALAGAELVAARCADQDELIRNAAGAEVIWLEWVPPVDRHVLSALPECRLVMRWGAGYDQIDVRAATELGVAIANAPTYCTENVAEHALALLLAMTRGVAAGDAAMHACGWRGPAIAPVRLAGRTLGIIGLGRIGRRVAELGAAFGCTVIAHDVRSDLVPPNGVRMTGLTELMAEADFVSLHTVLNEASHHLVNASLLAGAKPGLLLVNTSRGGVVDQAALLAAVESGVVAGALRLGRLRDRAAAARQPAAILPGDRADSGTRHPARSRPDRAPPRRCAMATASGSTPAGRTRCQPGSVPGSGRRPSR